jgi:hypothetical protein
LGLLERKTPEQKALEKQAKEEEKARKAAELQLKRDAEAAAKAKAAAEYKQFTDPLSKWEYKVLTKSASAGWGDGKVNQLEPELNGLAREGWRVVGMGFTGQIEQALAMNQNHLTVILERPARYDRHVGHPVQRDTA